MNDEIDQFDWRPMSGKWRTRAVTAAIVLACGSFGVFLAQGYPLGPIISAIERNGVPAVASSVAPQRDLGNTVGTGPTSVRVASLQAHQVTATSPPRADPAAQPIHPRILNPGTAEEPAHAADQTQGLGLENVVRRPQPQASSLVERQPIARVHPKETIANDIDRGTRNRNVLVVVRRVVPPYDTKILRGHIQDGHLIVDSRDRRGMTIR
jgi:hypothetical protein